MSDKAGAFNSKTLIIKKFDTEVFREKDAVISPGYDSIDIKQLEKLLGKNEN